MNPVHRIYVAVFLSAMLSLAGVGVASSRGIDSVAGQMVLCTGAGPVVVYTDKNGQPTQAPHYCPEFALSLLGALAGQQTELAHIRTTRLPQPSRGSTSLIAALVPNRPARAPPRHA